MPICKPQEFLDAINASGEEAGNRGARIIGLDVGASTVGIALSDASLLIATAHSTIRRGRKFKPTADALLALLDETGAVGAVIGLPLDLSGRQGPRAQASSAFARNLMEARDIPTILWDERMSTNAVQRAMLEADLSRAKRDAIVDKAAAAFILQGFLDHLHDGLHTPIS